MSFRQAIKKRALTCIGITNHGKTGIPFFLFFACVSCGVCEPFLIFVELCVYDLLKSFGQSQVPSLPGPLVPIPPPNRDKLPSHAPTMRDF